MNHDPRNPHPDYMVRTESTHHAHDKLRKTLVLLKLAGTAGPIYFVVEGMSDWPETLEEMHGHASYFYETHTCPSNWLGVEMVSAGGDHDPHGLFEFVDAVWMTDEYTALRETPDDQEAYIVEVFPQLSGGET